MSNPSIPSKSTPEADHRSRHVGQTFRFRRRSIHRCPWPNMKRLLAAYSAAKSPLRFRVGHGSQSPAGRDVQRGQWVPECGMCPTRARARPAHGPDFRPDLQVVSSPSLPSGAQHHPAAHGQGVCRHGRSRCAAAFKDIPTIAELGYQVCHQSVWPLASKDRWPLPSRSNADVKKVLRDKELLEKFAAPRRRASRPPRSSSPPCVRRHPDPGRSGQELVPRQIEGAKHVRQMAAPGAEISGVDSSQRLSPVSWPSCAKFLEAPGADVAGPAAHAPASSWTLPMPWANRGNNRFVKGIDGYPQIIEVRSWPTKPSTSAASAFRTPPNPAQPPRKPMLLAREIPPYE